MQSWKLLIKILLFTIIFYGNVFANEKPRIFAFHINGVNTTKGEAKRNINELEKTAQMYTNMITWHYLYNPSHGLLTSDLADVFRQKKQENKNLTVDDYVEIYLKTYNHHFPKDSPEFLETKKNIKELYLKDLGFVGANFDFIVNEFHAKSKATESIRKFVHSFQDKNNAYFLFIPHSQGNLYANSLVSYLMRAEGMHANHLAIFGIANAANLINTSVIPEHGGDTYITADNDYVINALRTFHNFAPVSNPPTLANTHLDVCYDYLCHNLIDSYLLDQNVANQIMHKTNYTIMSLISTIKDENKTAQLDFIGWSVWIFDQNNKLMCYNNMCEDDIGGYTFFKYSKDRFHHKNFNISYPGAIKPGHYTLVDMTNEPYKKYGESRKVLLWSNKLVELYGYTVSIDENSKPQFRIHRDVKNIILNDRNYHYQFEPIIYELDCNFLPQYCFFYDDRLYPILGGFVIGE